MPQNRYLFLILALCVPSVAHTTDLARTQNQAGHYLAVTDERTGCNTSLYPRRAYSKDRSGEPHYGCWRYDHTNIYIQWNDMPGTEVVYPLYLFESLIGRDT